jgi:hypothetical protein
MLLQRLWLKQTKSYNDWGNNILTIILKDIIVIITKLVFDIVFQN